MTVINLKIIKRVDHAKTGMIIDSYGNVEWDTIDPGNVIKLYSTNDVAFLAWDNGVIDSGYSVMIPKGYNGYTWPAIHRTRGVFDYVPGWRSGPTKLGMYFRNTRRDMMLVPAFTYFAFLFVEKDDR